MKLLGRITSINVRKVLWTSLEIGLSLDHEDAWGTSAQTTRSPEFLRLNPNGLVPVYIDDRGPLWESNTICRYLARRYERRDLLPRDAYDRALVERWMDWTAGDLNRAWSYAFMALGRNDASYADADSVNRSVDAWNGMMTVLDAYLASSGRYACGDAFTLADISLGLAAHRWCRTPMRRPELNHVGRYLDALRERAPFAALANDELP